MGKRSIAISLLLLGLGFVGVVHVIADLAYDTSLAGIGIVLAGFALIGIGVVNR